MRMTTDHNLAVSVRRIALGFFQIMQNVDAHATDAYDFGFRDCLSSRPFVVIPADGNDASN